MTDTDADDDTAGLDDQLSELRWMYGDHPDLADADDWAVSMLSRVRPPRWQLKRAQDRAAWWVRQLALPAYLRAWKATEQSWTESRLLPAPCQENCDRFTSQEIDEFEEIWNQRLALITRTGQPRRRAVDLDSVKVLGLMMLEDRAQGAPRLQPGVDPSSDAWFEETHELEVDRPRRHAINVFGNLASADYRPGWEAALKRFAGCADSGLVVGLWGVTGFRTDLAAGLLGAQAASAAAGVALVLQGPPAEVQTMLEDAGAWGEFTVEDGWAVDMDDLVPGLVQ